MRACPHFPKACGVSRSSVRYPCRPYKSPDARHYISFFFVRRSRLTAIKRIWYLNGIGRILQGIEYLVSSLHNSPESQRPPASSLPLPRIEFDLRFRERLGYNSCERRLARINGDVEDKYAASQLCRQVEGWCPAD